MVTAVNQVLSASVMVRPGACLYVAPTSISSSHRPRCSMTRSLMCRSSLMVIRAYRHSPGPCEPGVGSVGSSSSWASTAYVVTHPQSQHHVDGLVGGWFDSELSALGAQQAGLIASELRRRIPNGAAVEVFSSDLRRTRATADAIAQALSASVEADVFGNRTVSGLAAVDRLRDT